MQNEMIFDKLKTARGAEPRVVFGYKYLYNKLDNYISLTNLRLEIVQAGEGKILYTSAAPVLDVDHGKLDIKFADSKLLQVVSGSRANIIIREHLLEDGEQAFPPGHVGTEEVDENSRLKVLHTVYDYLTGSAYPGYDMRVPEMFRMTKNPSRLRLNVTPDLLAALGLEPGTPLKTIQEVFLSNLASISTTTADGGNVLPFDWVHAGGMVCADATLVGKLKPKILYTRSLDFLRKWVTAKRWTIQCA